MELRMLRYGLCVGFGFLLAVALVEWIFTTAEAEGGSARSCEPDISDQIFDVLAEARRITVEGA